MDDFGRQLGCLLRGLAAVAVVLAIVVLVLPALIIAGVL